MVSTYFTIREIADLVGVCSKTIVRWERRGIIPKPKRDYKGWRAYSWEDYQNIKSVTVRTYTPEEYNENIRRNQNH